MKIVVIGEIVGRPALEYLQENISQIKNIYNPDVIIANGDSVCDGYGINIELAEKLLNIVDIVTLGDNALSKKDFLEYLDKTDRIIRPYNLPESSPGKGFVLYRTKNGIDLLVVSLLGRNNFTKIFVNDPYITGEKLIEQYKDFCKNIIIDFHGGTTSEVQGTFWHFSKKASVVYGSHLKVLTNDFRIIDDWTGVITGIGYCGGEYSIGGFSADIEIKKMVTGRHFYSRIEKDDLMVQGIVTEIDENSGKCLSIDILKYKK